MQLKSVIESPCGLRYMLDDLDLQSGFTRRWLLERQLMTSPADIERDYDMMRHFTSLIERVDYTRITTLIYRLQGLKDIRTTVRHLEGHATLDDIELFEVKHLAILAVDIAQLLRDCGMDGVVDIPADVMSEVIAILDPDGMKIATFYIYDSYCRELQDLRSEMRRHPERQEELLLQTSELEDGVRRDLSAKLCPMAHSIEQTQIALAIVDFNLAKAKQMKRLNLCYPSISTDGMTRYSGLFHPQVQEVLEQRKKTFQPIDVTFGKRPTLITGANMGGKTVVLKTLTLCQYLFQMGMGIPASEASIDVKDEIYFCIGDDQSVEKGLSSFAAEMKNIDAVIKASRKERKLLALIDEPARTTNPTEGTALVSALLKVLADADMSLVLTTHYDIEPGEARCLRVKGFDNGVMNYSLVEVHDGEVPHEALNIAEALNIDPQWIALARDIVNSKAE